MRGNPIREECPHAEDIEAIIFGSGGQHGKRTISLEASKRATKTIEYWS